MARHKHLIVGAGRIGAAFSWHDDAYSHAGASKALSDRVDLVGFVEPDSGRALAASAKWGAPAGDGLINALQTTQPDIVSVCVQPEQQDSVIRDLDGFSFIKGIWCEKPYVSRQSRHPVQINFMRRGDKRHQELATTYGKERLVVYGKKDIHTVCHFTDLAKWWNVALDYREFIGPCAYILTGSADYFFDNGGVDGGKCFKAMLGNLLDHVDKGVPLWSPAR